MRIELTFVLNGKKYGQAIVIEDTNPTDIEKAIRELTKNLVDSVVEILKK